MSIFILSQIAEYPINPLSRSSLPFNIKYSDVIKKKERKWEVFSHSKTGRGAFKTLVNLLQLWDGKSDKIFFTRRELLMQMGINSGGSAYAVLKKDLDSLTDIKIKTSIPNVSEDEFVLFQHIHRDESTWFIQFSDPFHKIATNPKNQYKIEGDIEMFNSLSPVAQKLFAYLGKWCKHYQGFQRDFETLCNAIPIRGSEPRKRKQQLKEALEEVQAAGLIKHWNIKKGSQSTVVEITRSTKVVGKEQPNHPDKETEHNIASISLFLGVSMRSSAGWWRFVSQKLGDDLIEKAINNSREQIQNIMSQGKTVRDRGKILTHHCKKIAEEKGISLSNKTETVV